MDSPFGTKEKKEKQREQVVGRCVCTKVWAAVWPIVGLPPSRPSALPNNLTWEN